MKKIIPLIIASIFITLVVSAQNCDSLINLNYSFDSLTLHYNKTGVNYCLPIYRNDGDSSCEGKTCSSNDHSIIGDTSSFTYKVFYPALAKTKRLPTIILFHGGGFSACADPAMGVEYYCREFAKRNFVAISVEYRKGRIKDSKNKFTSASQTLAIYRAIQDGRGAIRTIVADEKSNAQPFHVDFNNLFVGGVSAGAIIALGIADFDTAMISQTFPGVSAVLGSIDADNYKGNKPYTIKGVMDMWGGASIPVSTSAATFFQNTAKPFIAFHGALDSTIFISSSNLYFSKVTGATCDYSSTNLCVNYSYPSGTNNGNAYLTTLGSQKLYDAWHSLHILSELYVDCQTKHGLNDTTNFGTDISLRDVRVYMVQRAVTFFQAVMNGAADTTYGLSEFIENENLRVGCKPENHGQNLPCYIPAPSANTAANAVIADEKTNSLFNSYVSNKIIHISLHQVQPSMFYLYDMNGTLLRKMQSSSNNALLDGTALSSGIYFLKIIQGNRSENQKIILQ